MPKDMETLRQQISQNTGVQLTLLQEGFHANHLAQQDREKEVTMTATSGLKLSELLNKQNPASLFLKTFLDSRAFWNRAVRLQWKRKRLSFFQKVTTVSKWSKSLSKSSKEPSELLSTTLKKQDIHYPQHPHGNRSFYVFQLVPLERHIDGTGFGLLPTPLVMDTNCGDLEKINQRRKRQIEKKINGNGFGMTVGEMANRGLLPTPKAQNKNSPAEHGQGGMDLQTFVAKSMLPTPMQADWKGSKKKRKGNTQLTETLGVNSQLNPRFVAEMMGFPPDWLELPFQNTETNQ